jgi:hypothetical protein
MTRCWKHLHDLPFTGVLHSAQDRKRIISPQIEDTCIQSLASLASFLLLHVTNKNLSHESVTELQKILKGQATLADQNVSGTKTVETVDSGVVQRLVGRGYSEIGSRRAAIATQNKGFQAALQWAVAHCLDSDFEEPIVIVGETTPVYVNRDFCQRLETALLHTAKAITDESEFKASLLRGLLVESVDRTVLPGAGPCVECQPSSMMVPSRPDNEARTRGDDMHSTQDDSEVVADEFEVFGSKRATITSTRTDHIPPQSNEETASTLLADFPVGRSFALPSPYASRWRHPDWIMKRQLRELLPYILPKVHVLWTRTN